MHPERLRANNIRWSQVPGYSQAVSAAQQAVRKPDGPPVSGQAVIVPPPRRGDRPEHRLYSAPHPRLWVFWAGRWKLAIVISRRTDQDGTVSYEADFYDQGERARVRRQVQWGPDSVRKVD